MSQNPYPEHLNPFAEDLKPKRKHSIGSSFKEFTKTVRRSFRIKKKPDSHVEYRIKRRDEGQTSGLSPIRPHTEAPVAYPRFRFQDRLTLRNDRRSHNPFDEGENALSSPPQPAVRRKGKKKAPLPPKSISSQNVSEFNESDEHRNASNWSLTSADTDYTFSTENLSEKDFDDKLSLSENVTKELQNFNKEMERMNEDSNNNNNEPQSVANISNIPDLVVTCPNSDSDTHSHKTEDAEEDKEDQSNIINNNIIKNDKIEERGDKSVSGDEDTEEELLVRDLTENLQNPDDDELPFQFNERKSIFIEGSTDQLDSDKCVEKTLYIAGSKEELDNCNNNDVNLEQDVAANNSAHPEKHRKAKLTRDSLLGTTA